MITATRMHAQFPRRRRLADPARRTIRVGPVLWRARLIAPDDASEPIAAGRALVRFESVDGAQHCVTMAAGELERISNYRLRSIIMGFAEHDGAGLPNEDSAASAVT